MLAYNYCVRILGCSTSHHIHFDKKEVQTDDLGILYGVEMHFQSVDDSMYTITEDSKSLQIT